MPVHFYCNMHLHIFDYKMHDMSCMYVENLVECTVMVMETSPIPVHLDMLVTVSSSSWYHLKS